MNVPTLNYTKGTVKLRIKFFIFIVESFLNNFNCYKVNGLLGLRWILFIVGGGQNKRNFEAVFCIYPLYI